MKVFAFIALLLLAASTTNSAQTGYAPINGLRMYYEIHGPTLLPHGQLTILPGTEHMAITSRTDWVVTMVNEFQNAAERK
jgi:hypothetical protein